MSVESLDKWLERLRAGEHEAFDELVRRYHGPVFRLAFRLLHNRDDAQEVAQESFLAAYQGIAGYAARASLQTWLLSIAYRKAVDRLRRDDRTVVSAGTLDDAELRRIAQDVQSLTDWVEDPEQHFERGQLREQLRVALARLPAESQAVFELRDVQGLSSREAAQVLGVAEGTLRVRLHRVRQYLMTELKSALGGKGVQR